VQTVNTAAATLSAGFTAAAACTAERIPVAKVEIQWSGSTFVDETVRLMAFDFANNIAEPAAGLVPIGTVDIGTLTLRNEQWRYSALHVGGDGSIRSYLAGDRGVTGIKCRLSIGFMVSGSPEYVWGFTGYLFSVGAQTAKKNVTFQIRDNAWYMVQKKTSTAAIAINQTAGQVVAAAATLGSFDGTVLADDDPVVIPLTWSDDESAFDDAALAVQAVAGRIWVDGPGNLRFESASHWLTHTSKAWTFTAGSQQELGPTGNPSDLVTEVIVEYSPRVAGISGVLWSLDKPRIVRPGATEVIKARFNQPALAVFALADEDWRAETSGGLSMRDYIKGDEDADNPDAITVTPTAAGATITIRNTNQVFAVVMRFLQLRGVPIVGGPSQQVSVLTGTGDNYRVRSERGNPYIQTHTQANFLAHLLAERHKRLQTSFMLRNIPGVPQLELGDRVGVSDGRAVSVEREGFVIGIAHKWTTPERGSPSQIPIYSQTLTVLDAAAMFSGSGYFVIGTTALSGVGVPGGKAWY
jgi:hypothetical protein